MIFKFKLFTTIFYYFFEQKMIFKIANLQLLVKKSRKTMKIQQVLFKRSTNPTYLQNNSKFYSKNH